MKHFKFFFCGFIALFAFNVYATTIISDLDDTIKHTHIGNTRETIKNGLFSKKPFGGMATLYSTLTDEFTLVTGSPKQIRRLVQNFLEDAHFPPATIYMRRHLWEDIEKYKNNTLTEVIARAKAPILLVGDDTEKDPHVFLNMQKSFPKKVAGIYIRRVAGKTLPEGATGFYHPFEIAVYEWEAGRLDTSTLISLGLDLEFEFDLQPHLFFPKHVVCPNSAKLFQLDTALLNSDENLRRVTARIIHKTLSYCISSKN